MYLYGIATIYYFLVFYYFFFNIKYSTSILYVLDIGTFVSDMSVNIDFYLRSDTFVLCYLFQVWAGSNN